ncbi:MAG: Glycosyltransferase family 92 [Candidatus Kentron sp. G]|nr:MAG: Glycosyltransferase family 92 [Candidatus Kentron sp. G]VFN00676.1 MAG: Glycosyltransferase family 92 [Candidatus Kentron sp. G]VFN02059.1 MAG: Glycosyltransferase family 92 [Candidatus Kentron sp. G]
MNHRYFLVFATNFKDENTYLREWLEYHLLVGVEHFYLYDQCNVFPSQLLFSSSYPWLN